VVVLAFKTPHAKDARYLAAQAQKIQARWGLPTEKWLKALYPYRG
jgi:hypothetical protein